MTTPTIATVRAALKLRFDGIADIGRVHDYERYTKQIDKLIEFYVADINNEQQLRGLHFRRVSTRESYHAVNRWHIYHRWQARYFMALNDAAASEETFDSMIETIRDDFRVNPKIVDGLRPCDVVNDQDEGGVQVSESQPVMFGGVLCHSARLTFTTRQLE